MKTEVTTIDTAYFCTATYSPEDDKLRIYASERLDAELWQRMKKLGFRWAPKQELFFTVWSPAREDLCIELAGEITAEETTLIERAEQKVERLEALSVKRAAQSNAFYDAARDIGQRFAAGQPILIGHHSQRSAERDRDKMNAAMQRSVDAAKAADYWNYRAGGVERHANQSGGERTRRNRIKKLFADLRVFQRRINFSVKALKTWQELAEKDLNHDDEVLQAINYLVGAWGNDGSYSPSGTYDDLRNAKISAAEAVQLSVAFQQSKLDSPHNGRVVQHLLNRLGFEHAQLDPVQRFDGTLSAAILQTFTRTHGADKPKAKRIDGNWSVTSPVPLPPHLSNSETLTLNDDEWRDLMQGVSYAVPAPKPSAPPILNFRAESILIKTRSFRSEPQMVKQVAMTKEEYMAIYSDSRTIVDSGCGGFRVRAFKRRWNDPMSLVFLTDSKEHPVPESDAVVLLDEAG